jgi:hypothetical protein
MTNTTNGDTTPQADEAGELFPAHYPRIELETTVVYEGFTFRVVFRDVSLREAVAALTRRGCTPAESVGAASAATRSSAAATQPMVGQSSARR